MSSLRFRAKMLMLNLPAARAPGQQTGTSAFSGA